MEERVGNRIGIQVIEPVALSLPAPLGAYPCLHPLREAEIPIPGREHPRLRCRLSECADKQRHLRGGLDVRGFEGVQVIARPEHRVICQPFHAGAILLHPLLDFVLKVGNRGGWRQGLGRKSGQHRIGSHRSLLFPVL